MGLRVYNSRTREKEDFTPLAPPAVTMYVCGITPYDETHVGHARAYCAFDVIRRYLEYSGYKVRFIQNITDIDDKIINKANAEGKTIKEISERYSASFFDVMEKLKVKKAASYPKATEHISEMIDLISGMIKDGCAYISGSDVYFSVSSFERYGALSGRELDDMKAGSRVEINEKKRHPLDFVLWKESKEGEPYWESPWGLGRPGWHTECVVMSRKYLGPHIDIHGGGADLVFPHHENEMAQAECSGGGDFVKYWMHNGFITVNKEKMSKSLGNFFTVSDVLKKYEPMVLRYFLIRTHYRNPINFSDDDLNDAKAAYSSITGAYDDMQFMLRSAKNDKSHIKFDNKAFKDRFVAAMDDDINTPAAVAVVFELIKFYHENKFKLSNEDLGNIVFLLEEFGNILQLGLKESKVEIKEDMNALLEKRNEARRNKDFKEADRLRSEIESKGYIIDDTPFGSFIKKKGEEPKKPEKEIKDPFGVMKKKK